jgi:hypothetical protein
MIGPIYGSSYVESRINFDGVLASRQPPGAGFGSYTQLFRNGSIETVDAEILKRRNDDCVVSVAFEFSVLQAMERYLKALAELGVSPPLSVMMSLLDVRGYRMVGFDLGSAGESKRIDRDDLVIPEKLLDSFEVDLDLFMREPFFDAVWHAMGFDGSGNYDEKGRHKGWKPRRE